MTTFAFDFDHATALSADVERAAANIREPVPPQLLTALGASPNQHDFYTALERATAVTATQSRILAQRLSFAADSGFRMVRDAGLAESTTSTALGGLDESLNDGFPVAHSVANSREVTR
ncbi:hypothetical protein [Corynebacterium sp. MNWGS58]|uniref:hypothetical protein n=1 Tax=Corynebacterium sp. 102791.4 TaxID=3104612 RepID=UPI00351587D3